MKLRWVIITTFLSVSILLNAGVSFAVSTTDIDQVRAKGLLEDTDLQVIDDFVAEAVQELVNATDFTSIAKTRTIIVARKNSENADQGQYRVQFLQSSYRHISEALRQAWAITDEQRKVKVLVNLLILTDRIEELRLADLSIGALDNHNPLVCYWAVHSLTNPAIRRQLNSSQVDNPDLAKRIIEKFGNLVAKASPEITGLMVDFVAGLETRQADELLIKIADKRISEYANWTVKYELLEISILKSLYEKISSQKGQTAAFTRRFAQLYSYVLQRYIKGQQNLSEKQKGYLASVLVEIENCCIWRLLGMPQTTIKKAVEQDDFEGLWREHNRILGEENKAGALAVKFAFDYGQDSDGGAMAGPIPLSEPLENVSAKSETAK
ncbi:MAG: hypothetical protein JXB29_06155 [Sedimentisphaerales bacterium]|nr:hypothetical protein [Sedimentisphaerales bacterium]